jgi:glycosyltransferase involved in cell wall biosynthesis
MPVYNREKYLHQAIDSVLSQTFTDYELITVDDGSTDRSLEILESYGSRIRVIRQQNRGPEVARNAGAAEAQGEYIALLDSDDFFFPFTLEVYDRVIRYFDSPALVVGAHLFFLDGEPTPLQPQNAGTVEAYPFKDCLSKTIRLPCVGSLYVIRRSIHEAAGGFRNSDARTWYGDIFDYILRVGTLGPCVIIRQPFTAAYRQHEANSTASLKAHADGILGVARAERLDQYPGGWLRRWDRYAFIGGISESWARHFLWPGRERRTALRLLLGTAPMVLAALVKRVARNFHKPAQRVLIPEEPKRVETIAS